MDRKDAIKDVSQNLRDLVADSTPASLCGSFIDVTQLIHPLTNQLKGKTFYIYSGAGAGQQRVVGSFQVANRRVHFPESFASLPSTNSNFFLFDYWSKDDYDNALDRIIGKARTKHLEDMAATISIVATQYEYAVPSGMDYISSLKLVPSSAATDYSDYANDVDVDRYHEIPPRFWHIDINPLGSYTINLDSRLINLNNIDGNSIRIIGQAKPVVLASDNATIPAALEEFVVTGATMLLASQRIDENREWYSKFRVYRDLYNGMEEDIFRYRRGKPVK